MASSARLVSWVAVDSTSDFPLENLPYGVFRTSSTTEAHIGAALGSQIIDLFVLASNGVFTAHANEVLKERTLNAFMGAGRPVWTEVRGRLQQLFSESNRDGEHFLVLQSSLVAQSDAQMQLPAAIGDYTDFYSSRPHATNVGIMFRGVDNALQPNWYVSSPQTCSFPKTCSCFFCLDEKTVSSMTFENSFR